MPANINPSLCTHIPCEYAKIRFTSQTMETDECETDIHQRFYQQITNLKKSHRVHVSIVLGEARDSSDDRYSRLVRNAEARAHFVNCAIKFIERHKFDGLAFDWYPVCWQGDCRKGYWDEKRHFVDLMQELSREFKPRNWSLLIAIPIEKLVWAFSLRFKSYILAVKLI